jgi:hypothetical protein
MAHLDPLGVFQLIDAKLKTSPHREQLSVLRRRLAGEVAGVPELVDETLAPGFTLVMQAGGARRVLGRDAVIAAARGSAAGLSWAEADDLVVDDGVIAGHGRLCTLAGTSVSSAPFAFFITFDGKLMTSEVLYLEAASQADAPDDALPTRERLRELLGYPDK